MTELVKSVFRYTFNKKVFIALIFVIVLFSAIFTSYTLRLGTAFGYDGVMTEDGLFVYRFTGGSRNIMTDSDFVNYFQKYGFSYSSYGYIDGHNLIKAGDYTCETRLYKLSSPEDIAKYPGIEKYITADDVIKGNKLIVADKFQVSDSSGNIDEGKTLLVNGVEYLVAGIENFVGEYGEACSYIIVDCDELRATYDSVYYSVFTKKEISNSKLNKIAESAGLNVNIPEKNKFILGFLAVSAIVCALFMINIAILFNAFVKAGDKFYAVFKILGINTAKLVAVMALPSLIIAFVASVAGVAIDFAMASVGTVLEKSVRLTAGGAAAIIVLNTAGAFIGTAIASIRPAKDMPAESLRRTE